MPVFLIEGVVILIEGVVLQMGGWSPAKSSNTEQLVLKLKYQAVLKLKYRGT